MKIKKLEVTGHKVVIHYVSSSDESLAPAKVDDIRLNPSFQRVDIDGVDDTSKPFAIYLTDLLEMIPLDTEVKVTIEVL